MLLPSYQNEQSPLIFHQETKSNNLHNAQYTIDHPSQTQSSNTSGIDYHLHENKNLDYFLWFPKNLNLVLWLYSNSIKWKFQLWKLRLMQTLLNSILYHSTNLFLLLFSYLRTSPHEKTSR